MQFFLVRETTSGRLLHHEVADASAVPRAFDDPFWDQLNARKRELVAQYPEAQIVEAFGPSVEEFLAAYPEYQEFAPGPGA